MKWQRGFRIFSNGRLHYGSNHSCQRIRQRQDFQKVMRGELNLQNPSPKDSQSMPCCSVEWPMLSHIPVIGDGTIKNYAGCIFTSSIVMDISYGRMNSPLP